MKVEFLTPTVLSLLDLTTMGDSTKRGDSTKIGQFDSGLKYAIALLLRNGVSIEIVVHTQHCVNTYIPNTKSITDSGKTKSIISIYQQTATATSVKDNVVETGFAEQLGYNWELWMAFRELASNTFDEDGFYTDNPVQNTWSEGTTIKLEFEPDSAFGEVWKNRNLYVNQQESIYELNNLDILSNPEGFLKIYKQDILVHSDREVPSLWAYNIHFGELDERRTLLRLDDIQTSICQAIANSNDPAFVAQLVSKPNENNFDSEDFIWNNGYVYTLSSTIVQRAYDLVDFSTLPWINKLIRKRPDCQLPGREVTTLADSIWVSSKNIKVNTVPIASIEELTFREKILKYYNLDIGDLEIKEALMTGGKCFADRYNNCLIISNDFDIQKDMPEFIIQYFDYNRDRRESLLTHIGVEYCKLISKP